MSHFIQIYNHQLRGKHTTTRNPAQQCGTTGGKHAVSQSRVEEEEEAGKHRADLLCVLVVVVFLPVKQLVVQDRGRFVRGAVDAPHCCCCC